MKIEDSVEIKVDGVKTIDNAVVMLINYRNKGENVFMTFNGVKLYSANVTIDSAYLEVTGLNKADFEIKSKELLDEYYKKEELRKEKTLENIEKWIKKGNNLVYAEKKDLWNNFINKITESYLSELVDEIINIMDALEEKMDIEDVKKLISDDHSGHSYSILMTSILNFSKRGPEFYRSVEGKNISENEKNIINKIEEENKLLESKHKLTQR